MEESVVVPVRYSENEEYEEGAKAKHEQLMWVWLDWEIAVAFRLEKLRFLAVVLYSIAVIRRRGVSSRGGGMASVMETGVVLSTIASRTSWTVMPTLESRQRKLSG